MSTEYATNPRQDLHKPEHIHDGYLQVDVSDWCEHYDMMMPLMPFDYRNYDPIEACRNIKETLDGMHDLAQTFMSKDCNISHLAGSKTINPLLRLYRVTWMRETSKGQRYKNPQYEHYDACITPITDHDERVTFYENWKDVPSVDGNWFSKHFGIEPSPFYRWVKNNGYVPYSEQDRYNRQRLGRTIATVAMWTEWSQREIMEILPLRWKRMDGHIQRHVRNSGWKPPERPGDKPWFRSA